MPYDPNRHHRRSTRLHGYDYAAPGAYFVTLCTHERACLFGEIIDGQMHPNAWGQIVEEEWLRSEEIRAEIILDAYVVMPNHLHGIVLMVPLDADPSVDPCDPCGYRLDPTVGPHGRAALHRPPKSLGAFIAGFKSAATTRINALRGTPGGKVWQYKFYDRILRDERAWRACRRYIEQNPARWNEDKNHPDRL